MTETNLRFLKQINNKIEKRTKKEHIEILRIVKKSKKSKITENNNGCFVDLNEIENDIIEELSKFIEFQEIKEKELKTMEKEKHDIANYLKEPIV